jgi:hypothetical protein
MIAKNTGMMDMPKNCANCHEISCTVPFIGDDLMEEYILKRHPRCPLIEVEDDIKWVEDTYKGEVIKTAAYKRKPKEVEKVASKKRSKKCLK